MRPARSALGSLFLCLTACSGGTSPSTERIDAAAPALGLADLTVTENPSNALSIYVAWSSERPASTKLTVRCGRDYDTVLGSDVMATEHEVFVMGLYSGAECDLDVESVSEDGATGTATTTFTAGALPDFLPELQMWITSPDRQQPGWTLVNLSNQVGMDPLIVALIDERARYRWYYQRPGPDPGGSTELVAGPDGVLIGGGGNVPVSRANWEGEQVWEAGLFQHHDIRALGDGRYIFLGVDYACPEVAADSIVVWDERTESVVDFWSHCEHYRPVPFRDDWSHLNAIVPFPGTNSVLISSRNESSLFKVNLDTDDIEWMFGFPPSEFEPADLPRIELVEGERFYLQHAPELSEDGRSLLLFDNGSDFGRRNSRVVEVAIDEKELEARVIREFRPVPDVLARLWGDADRLPNGNVLSVWGSRTETPSRIIEFFPNGDVVWHVVTPVTWGVYRADRIVEPLAGYVLGE